MIKAWSDRSLRNVVTQHLNMVAQGFLLKCKEKLFYLPDCNSIKPAGSLKLRNHASSKKTAKRKIDIMSALYNIILI